MAFHGLDDQVAAQAVAEQLGELVDEVAQVGAALEGDARDVAAEQKLKAQIADLDSKFSSLQSKGIIRDKQSVLPLCLVAFRQAITSDPFESAAWVADPTKRSDISRTGDDLLHQFLKRR